MPSEAVKWVLCVLDVGDVNERGGRYTVRRVLLPRRGLESFTVVGPDRRR